jgi:hypothetical protein
MASKLSRFNRVGALAALATALLAAACSDSSGPLEPASDSSADSGAIAVQPAPVVSNYAIAVRYIGSLTARQKEAVTKGVARWRSAITRDLVNIPVSAPAGSCFAAQPALNETVDDILIFVEFVDIDGVGDVLGQAGPCYVRADNTLPVVGYLKLDAADLEMMEDRGTLDDVVLHEMGHVLGIGTLWQDKNVLTGAGTDDPRFTGSSALAAYRTLGGSDTWIPVENSGAEGTRDGHWRESDFGSELMTGYINASPNAMSALTISSLTDIGYGTNPGAASEYTINQTTGGITLDLHKHERLVRPKFKIDRHGKKTKIERERP